MRPLNRTVKPHMDGLSELRGEVAALSSHMFKVRFPFTREFRAYSWDKLRHDLIAGATLTLVSVPQAIGFSLILGLPPMTLITTVVIGGFFSALFFSSHHHVFGPTTSVCLITAATIAANADSGLSPLELSMYMAVLIGIVQFCAGLLNFGEITKFISRSMVIGYTTGIGVLLFFSQVHNFMGYSSAPGLSFLDGCKEIVRTLLAGRASFWAVGIGILTLIIFETIHRLRPRWPEALIGLGALGIACQIFAHFVPALPFRIVSDEGALSAMLPSLVSLPSLHTQFALLPHLSGAIIAIAIIGMLEATAITKGVASQSGQHIEPNQELLGMGAGNLLCGLFGGSPASSSFSRSAVNYQSGGATQFSSMLSSVLVLVILLFITPVFNHIPVAALALHLMRVGYKLINRAQIRLATRSTRSDAVVFIVTLAAALLLPLDTAIYVGIGVALVLFLQKTSTPILAEYSFNEQTGNLAALENPGQRPDPEISIIHVEGDLYFGAADLFQSQIRLQAEDQNIRVFILRMKNARHLDATTVMALDSLHDYLTATGRHLLISGCNDEVVRVLRNSGIMQKIGPENIFPAADNPNVATRRALLRAKSLLGGQHADVRIFYDRSRPAESPSSSPPPPPPPGANPPAPPAP